MPRPEAQAPTVTEHGDQTHPAFGTMIVNRASVTPGVTLFDSSIKHREVVTLRITKAERKRDLNRDWIYPRQEIIEVQMSEAQWASMISSFGIGGGTPVTLSYTREDGLLPAIIDEPRLALSADETKKAAQEAIEHVQEALETYTAHKTVGNLRNLTAAINNLPANLEFAANSLTEHTERVVQKARADIEAMVTNKATALGLGPAATDEILALTPGVAE